MGKISRIQLRGISRTPSDRLTSDGGCAESLNAYLQDSEIAPALVPDDVTNIVGSDATYKAKKIFVHKTSYYETFVLQLEEGNQIGTFENGNFAAFLTLNAGEDIHDITSVGNTLIIASTKSLHYVLRKEGEYRYLGTSIPMPHIEFQCTPGNIEAEIANVYLSKLVSNRDNGLYNFNEEDWNDAIEKVLYDREDDLLFRKADLIKIKDAIWNAVNARIKLYKDNKLLAMPLFARYAVRLFDGSYIYQSVPLLLGSGYDKTVGVQGKITFVGNNTGESKIELSFLTPFVAKAYLRYWQTEGWSDIVKSVDIFVSQDVNYPNINSNISSLSLASDVTEGDTRTKSYNIGFENGGVDDAKAMENELLSKSLFYKIASFAVNDNSELESGYDISRAVFHLTGDKLAEFDRLPDYEQSDVQILPKILYTFNNRVLAAGGDKMISPSYSFLQSTNVKTESSPQTYAIVFYVKGSDGQSHKIVCRSFDGTNYHSTYQKTVVTNGETKTYYSRPYGMLFFPDTRCYKAEVWTSGEVYACDMKPHPFLNCSYAYWGLSKKLEEMSSRSRIEELSTFVSGENRKENDAHKLYVSAMNNPFYFPLSGNNLLSAKILGFAIAATTLSQGQFGQFPLYVFTEDGVWVMETAADGSFVTSKPLSREVCSNPASITPLDQAVIFLSQKGVMLLEGSQVVELSPNMNGKHYTVEDTAKTIIEGTTYSSLLPAASDSNPFMNFMKDAKIAYDYAGKRLIFISASNQGYQYVYKLDTSTWHKLTLGLNLLDPINSYPDCLITGTDGTYTKIYDLSTLLDVADADKKTAKILIATRPFDLGEPDVYKTITAVRIRGQYAAGAVKFILQGSHDGINFYTINTLRGKSWKLFKIIILANLAPTERISWVDIEYETRLTNKLR